MRGYFEIGICGGKFSSNIGTLWRSAYQLGAAGLFVIGHRFQKMSSDTTDAWKHAPLRQYESLEQMLSVRPIDCHLVGIETDGVDIRTYTHPERAIYLLGAEDYGLSNDAKKECARIISIPSIRMVSYNVSVAGSIVMYDRMFRKK